METFMTSRNRKRIVAVATAGFVLLCIIFSFSNGFGLLGVTPHENLNDYTWADLKVIAKEIKSAPYKEKGIEIAQKYHLVDQDGSPNYSNTKNLALNNGAIYPVCVVGIYANDLADNTGKAGITFMISDLGETYWFNAGNTNAGGWPDSELRQWMNLDLVRYFFGTAIEERMGNYVERVSVPSIAYSENTGDYVYTEDKLWLFSAGQFPKDALMPSDEGTYWLRSIDSNTQEAFQTVTSSGVIGSSPASDRHFVAPLFAF